jgi:hypothetical protein
MRRGRVSALFRGHFGCFRKGHDWDLVAHGPGGSAFTCMNCPAVWDSHDKLKYK